MKLKKIDWIKKYVKLILAYPSYRDVFGKLKNECTNRALVIGTPIHGNLGDHMIAEECIKFVNKLGYSEVIEIPEFLYELFPNNITIKAKDTIFIVGGGWMGNMYEDEEVIEDIIARYLNNKVIILPQTIFFGTKGEEFNRLKTLVKNRKNLYICVREKQSYDVLCRELNVSDKNSFLLPDMALLRMSNIKKKDVSKFNRIIFSLRNDVEKYNIQLEIEKIKKHFLNKSFSCINSSTVINKKIVRLKMRNRIIEEKIEEFANADLIITDRLHSMVFSLISGTKCIAIDNLTHKVRGVYSTWLKDYPGLLLVDDKNQLQLNMVQEMMNSQDLPIERDFLEYFNQLIEKIDNDDAIDNNKFA